MNEITKIHLGRQAFTISVNAYHELRTYIAAISKHVKDAEVVDEIELRMSELLAERGIKGGKVVLPDDVDYLKAQLGSPADFAEEESEAGTTSSDSKRLFRDTDNGMVAGVAAGLASYFGIDVLLIRLLFVILVFITVGGGVLLYILLWILVPEAKTSSERLQMAGKPVNLKSLKEVAEQADVKGAARRVNNAVAGPVNAIFNLLLKVVGIAFVALGLSTVFGLVAAETYYLARSNAWAQNNIFPIGLKEHVLLDIGLAISALIAILVILSGIAIYRRKWPIKTWVTGIMAGMVFIGLAVGGALTADVYPDVHNAYSANTHTTVRTVQPFSNVSFDRKGADSVNFVPSDKYMVAFNYYDHPNINSVRTAVNNGTLLIDTSNFRWRRDCSTVCFPVSYRLNITVYTPNALQLETQMLPKPLAPPAVQAMPTPN